RDLWVDRERARHGAWYEFFPRSEGGLKGAAERLDAVAEMGFDVVYLPPIHPIGTTARKGPNNTLTPTADDVGSPWAIGGPDGGHTTIHPGLGDEDDLARLVTRATELDLEIALDYALQCSPDHPWVTEHPEWFHQRPDGSIKYAENPPKKYQDIYPINFWPGDDGDRRALWEACRDILRYWIDRGVKIFRVDNPHTKPLAFWEWCIADVHDQHPDVLFLAEAFTRPAMMSKLAEIGFSQSYTYFTWRHGKQELREYVEELAHGPLADVMRPNFWPNTPDILGGVLRGGNEAAFCLRYVLAATLTPNFGVYSGYELLENQPAGETNEEYLFSEKYEVKDRDWDQIRSIAPFMTHVNQIRRRHPSFGQLRDIHFHDVDNEAIIAYSKGSVLVVVNLDPDHAQEATVHLDLAAIGLPEWGPFRAHDELTGDTFEWNGSANYVRLDPDIGQVAHILALGPS
ncbi:MAG: alpha-amylase family glycosyl hydrolase, partial [Acidimicrobiales bacterium]